MTNINITGKSHVFKYLIEYEGLVDNNFLSDLNYRVDGNDIYFSIYDAVNELDREGNIWVPRTQLFDTQYLPLIDQQPIFKCAKIRIYFPQYSVDTYQKGTNYALAVNTWIHGKCVWLGCWLTSRINALAAPGAVRYQEQDYYEVAEFEVLDPMDLVYSDDWKNWRHEICGEPDGLNNTGSILCFTLYPVTESDQGYYIMMDDWQGSQASINLSTSTSDYLGLHLDYQSDTPAFVSQLVLHEYFGDLHEYMMETYGVDIESIRYELVIKDNDNVYKFLTADDNTNFHAFTHEDLQFENWGGWKEGLFVQSSLVMRTNGADVLSLISNEIPLTQDVFARFVRCSIPLREYDDSGNITDQTTNITKIPLESINMNVYNIRAVNKIQNTVVQLDNPKDSKSGLIQPVFFRARDLQNLIIHPAVTENISLNLDAYKSKVDTFLLQIEGTKFQEYGRVGNGVIFKVIGANLPNEVTSGTYYILNQDSELITTGKYTYES